MRKKWTSLLTVSTEHGFSTCMWCSHLQDVHHTPQLPHGKIPKLRARLSDPAELTLLWENLGLSSCPSGVTDLSSSRSSPRFPRGMGQKAMSGLCFGRTVGSREDAAPNHRQTCVQRGRGKEDALTYPVLCLVHLKQKQGVLRAAVWPVRGHCHCWIQTDTRGEE